MAQPLIDDGLARAVAAGQPREGRSFVVGVMVDVHVGPVREARFHGIDELLERGLLRLRGVRPDRGEQGIVFAVLVDGDVPEQVLQSSTTFGERITFHVEPDVAHAAARQQPDTVGGEVLRGHLANRIGRSAGGVLRDLQPGLGAQSFERGHAHRVGTGAVGGGTQLFDGDKSGLTESGALVTAHARNQGQVPVVVAALTADLGPVT